MRLHWESTCNGCKCELESGDVVLTVTDYDATTGNHSHSHQSRSIMNELHRYGLKWTSPKDFICHLMDDGYWTPWHIANEAVEKRDQRITELELQLQPYLERDAEEARLAALAQRLELIVTILFPERPNHHYRKDGYVPTGHPEKLWWWNATSLEEYLIRSDGSAVVDVASYVGGGETETFQFIAFKEWINAEDPTALINEWCNSEKKRKDEAKHAAEIAKAKADLEFAASRFNALIEDKTEKGDV